MDRNAARLGRAPVCVLAAVAAFATFAVNGTSHPSCGKVIGSVRLTFSGDQLNPHNATMQITQKIPLRAMRFIPLRPLELSFGAIRGNAGLAARAATLLHQAAIVIAPLDSAAPGLAWPQRSMLLHV